MLNLFRSLLLATIMSFVTPIIFVGAILSSLFVVSQLPVFSPIGHHGTTQIWLFLMVFGDGYAAKGILTIASTFSIVGGLFDLFNFYRYQTFRSLS